MADDDFGPPLPSAIKKQQTGTGTGTVPGATPAAPSPVTVAQPPPAAAPTAPAAGPSANDIILQHLSQGGIGSDAVASQRAAGANANAMSGLNLDPEAAGMAQPGDSGLAQWWSDLRKNEPADVSRPQTWYDWATKTYSPSPQDFAKTFADAWTYGQAPTASWLAQKGGAQVPASLSPEAIRAQTEAASRAGGPMSPVVQGLGYALQPLNWVGLGPLADIGGAAAAKPIINAATKYAPDVAETLEKVVPRTISGGTQASTLSALKEQGAGGDPAEILKSAALAFPTGAAVSGAVPPVGEVTPGGVTASTAARLQALQEQLTKITIPEKDLGFSVGGKQNPTVQDVLDYKAQMEAVKPQDDPEGGSQVILNRINKAIGPGTDAADAIASRDAALQEHGNALMAQRWLNRVGLPGTDVRAQAAAEMDKYPEESAAQNAFKAIAGVQDPVATREVSAGARRAMIGGGAGAGHYIGQWLGAPETGTVVGGGAGNTLADAINFFMRPKQLSPLIQQQIAKQYPTMTGRALDPGSSLGQSLLYLTQGARQ
jgi:hypothetical protein